MVSIRGKLHRSGEYISSNHKRHGSVRIQSLHDEYFCFGHFPFPFPAFPFPRARS